MNSEVKTILDSVKITVDGVEVSVPNALLYFDGVADTFVLYSPSSESVGLAGDDKPMDYVEGWDIDVYSKTNYLGLSRNIKQAFIDAGWVYRGAGVDTYDEATQLYHRLLEFEKETGA